MHEETARPRRDGRCLRDHPTGAFGDGLLHAVTCAALRVRDLHLASPVPAEPTGRSRDRGRTVGVVITNDWTVSDIPDQQGRIAVVTGSNSGLGLETARALAGRGASVVMAVRSLDKGRAAIDEIRTGQPDADLELLELDLASLESIRTAAECASTPTSRDTSSRDSPRSRITTSIFLFADHRGRARKSWSSSSTDMRAMLAPLYRLSEHPGSDGEGASAVTTILVRSGSLVTWCDARTDPRERLWSEH